MDEMKLLVLAPATHYEHGAFGDLLTRLGENTVEVARSHGWDTTLIGLHDCGDHDWHVGLAEADAVLLLGGHDVDPRLYAGRTEYPGSGDHLPTADRRSIAVVQACFADRIPLLGICRGMHLINVAFGGTLDPHLPTEHLHRLPEGEPGMLAHLVDVVPRTHLESALVNGDLMVRSAHHQGVAALGEGLRASGYAREDGLVEAIELPDRPLLGVQWHPEDESSDPAQLVSLLDWLAGHVHSAVLPRRSVS